MKVRYKQPDSDASQLLEWPIRREQALKDGKEASDRFRFAAAVAGFGQLLRGGKYTGAFGYDEVQALARAARGDDPYGYRSEFLTLVGLAKALTPGKSGEPGQMIR